MTDYTFDTKDLAAIMRELLIQLMNRSTGFNQKTGENPAKAKDFFDQQKQLVKVRKFVELAYGKQKPGQQWVNIASVAMVMYQRIVDQGMSVPQAISSGANKLLEDARTYEADLR